MTSLTLPFAARLDAATGDVEPQGPITERRVSDLQGLIADEAAWRRAVDHGNPIVYRVVAAPVPEIAGELPFSITTIEPGAIGDEYYMTKGHAHTAPEGELYVGLVGRGVLLLHDGRETRAVEMGPGVAGLRPARLGAPHGQRGQRAVPVPGRLPGHGRARLRGGGTHRDGRPGRALDRRLPGHT